MARHSQFLSFCTERRGIGLYENEFLHGVNSIGSGESGI